MNELSEEQLISAGHGKWSQAGVPNKGWTCIDTEDLGEPELTCQMCESRTIRYVHFMEHPNFPEVLQVGCICAGNMEGSVNAARSRETSMQSRAGKRKRWLSRKWRVSAKGNPWIKADGYRVAVYFQRGGWGATIASNDNSNVQHCRRRFESVDRAKLAAFDHITALLATQEDDA